MHFIQLIVIITCILFWCDHIYISRYLSRLVLVFQFHFQFLFGSWQTKIQITNAKLTHEPTIIKKIISHAANYQHVDGICIYVVCIFICALFFLLLLDMKWPNQWNGHSVPEKKNVYIYFFMLISLQFDDSSYKCERKKMYGTQQQQLK